MRSIPVSTEVFAAIWADRQEGEEGEDAILRRKFGCTDKVLSQPNSPTLVNPPGGVQDTRNGVRFPEGFEIFRTYKKREYRAIAHSGAWTRQDNQKSYPTLNQLNQSVADGNENVWNGNWKYREEMTGKIRPISFLRNR